MKALSVWKLVASPDQAGLAPVALPGEIQTLDGASHYLPGGAYTTLRTYAGHKVLRFSDHIHRLKETAQLTGHRQRLDEDALRTALRGLLRGQAETEDVRIRLTLDLERVPGDIYLIVEPLVVPPFQAYQVGVRVITCDLHRQLPKAKLTRFIDRSAPVRRSFPSDVNEAVMVDAQGGLLEGLSSNFFAILGGVVWTAEKGVLSGITRAIVIECARNLRVSLRLDSPRMEDLSNFDEAFITSSSRSVLPVRQIDQSMVGSACPGLVTRLLMQAFATSIEEQTQPI